MSYAMRRLAHRIRTIGGVRHENVPECVRRHPTLAAETLAEGGDSYRGMPLRNWFKLMETAGFEPLFECTSTRKHKRTSFCYGRPAEGVTVVFTSWKGAVSGATAEMSVSSDSSCFAYSAQDVVLFTAYGNSGMTASRIRFDADAGFLLKLHAIATAFPQRLPFWWSRSRLGYRHDAGAPLMSTTDRWAFLHENGEESDRAESARRFAMLPDEWKDRVDASGGRPFDDALRLSQEAAA